MPSGKSKGSAAGETPPHFPYYLGKAPYLVSPVNNRDPKIAVTNRARLADALVGPLYA